MSNKFHYSIYLLAVFCVMLPFEYPLAQYGAGSILRYVGILTIAFASFEVVRIQNYKIGKDYRIIIVFWMLYVLLSVVWAYDQVRYSHFTSMYINNALMFLAVSVIRYNQDEANLLKKAYVVGVALLLLYMTFVPGAVTYSAWQHRLTLAAVDGTELLDQNYLASIMIVPFAIVLNEYLNKETTRLHKKIISISFCLGCVYYIFSTGSRSGLIAICFISILILRKNAHNNAMKVLVAVLTLIILIPYIINLLPEDILMRFTFEAFTGNTAESNARPQLWSIAFESLGRGLRIIFGYGSGSSLKIIGQSFGRDAGVHNFYIAHLVEFGLVGFVLFGAIIIRLIRDCNSSSNYDSVCGFIGILFMGIFLDLLTTKFFWASMMLMTVCASAAKQAVLLKGDIENDII